MPRRQVGGVPRHVRAHLRRRSGFRPRARRGRASVLDEDLRAGEGAGEEGARRKGLQGEAGEGQGAGARARRRAQEELSGSMISTLGRYKIVSEIGQGAMGVVYK